jgi:hypothetical protein
MVSGPVYTAPPPPTHPHRELGVILLVLGIILLVVGSAAAAYCSASFFGVCLDNPYAAPGAALAGLGVVLLIVGIVLMVLTGTAVGATYPTGLPYPPPAYAPPPGSYAPVAPYLAPPPPPPPGPSPPGVPADRFCPTCGGRNARISAFCHQCGAPLPPPG